MGRATVLFLAIGIIVRVIIAGHAPFYDWDEAIYAQVAREFISHPSLFTTYNGAPWMEKPVLPIAFISFLLKLFNNSEVWVRMGFAFVGIIVLFLLYDLTKLLYSQISQKRKAGKYEKTALFLLPVLITASSFMFVDRSGFVNTDILLALGWVGYIWAAAKKSYKYRLLFLIIGVWSKSLLGFYPIIIEPFIFEKNIKKNITHIKRLVLITLIPSIWYLAEYIKYGNKFIQAHIGDHLIRRIVSPIELHFGGRKFFALLVWKEFGLITILILASLFTALFVLYKKFVLVKKIPAKNKRFLYAAIFLSLPFFILLTITKSKISWYLTPLLPLFALSAPFSLWLIQNKILRRTLVLAAALYALFMFVQQTFLIKPSGEVGERYKIASCIKKTHAQKAGFLVAKSERDIRQVLEATNLFINSSFIYGGAPSIVYYSSTPITFIYNTQDFVAALKTTKFPLIIASPDDIKNTKIQNFIIASYKRMCPKTETMQVWRMRKTKEQ